MLGYQADPIWILSISQQRHADQIADVRHDELVHAAKQYCAARSGRHANVSRSRFERIAALIPAILRQHPRLAFFAPTLVHGR